MILSQWQIINYFILFLRPKSRHFKCRLNELTSLSLFSILFVQSCPQQVPVHLVATVTMRCQVMRSWALRLLLLHLVKIQFDFSFSSVWTRFSFSVFPPFSHPLSLSVPYFVYVFVCTGPYPVSPNTSYCNPSCPCLSAGMKTTVSEAEHPLLCEGTRRVKGDLALALMITYKDDQSKLKKVTSTAVIILHIC